MIETFFGKIGSAVAVALTFIGGLFAPQTITEPVFVPEYIEIPAEYEEVEEPELGVALPQVAAVFETSLAAPITSGATSLTLTANSVRGGGSVSGYNCFTIDEGSAQAEFVCGTASGTAITSLERGISPLDGVTEDTDLQFSHRRGANVKITDFPLIQRIKSQNNGEGTYPNVISYATGVTPSSGSQLADVEYVQSAIAGTSTLAFDKHIVEGTAGETVVAGNLLYLNSTDGEWYKTDTDTESTVNGRLLGIAQGAGTNGNPVGSGILIRGLDTNQSGLSAGAYYYAGSTAGGISTTISGRVVGQAHKTDATKLYFDPSGISSSTAQVRFSNTFSGQNTFSATTTFSGYVSGIGSTTLRVYTSSSTWTKPANLRAIIVKVQAAGGGGAGADTDSTPGVGASGSAGGYCEEHISASELTSTSSVHVRVNSAGTGGTTGGTPTNGTSAGASSFGSFCSANGGAAGTGDAGTLVDGGTATGGDININGGSSLPSVFSSNAITIGGKSVLGTPGLLTSSQNFDGKGYGYGGSGNYEGSSASAKSGGPGIVTVYEIF